MVPDTRVPTLQIKDVLARDFIYHDEFVDSKWNIG